MKEDITRALPRKQPEHCGIYYAIESNLSVFVVGKSSTLLNLSVSFAPA